ncbi:sugar nucleotide-binding protein [Micromonospora sp. WMMD882]|uniref:SDR family oxidoreductase n=1 Tax=Micromonospora sp. WMMD882 TaxID=3015151 RepID=UPI00248AF5CB|nr:sugar nucleotide-binding protein [Micromonospora sp. WMMD882]WBB80401.1 sugar nucleotide-binding protein [Micromonospora sp. WMMD882]
MSGRPRVLIMGSGFIAGHVGQRLRALGHAVTISSRRRPSTPETRQLDWSPVDVVDRDQVRELVDAVRPDAVVTVHGPSDITWCEENAAQAMAAHLGSARHLAEVLAGRRVVMISTDNVFPGRRDSCGESEPTEPANVYGRAKLAAERELLRDRADALALRVSLVYGWDSAGLRPNFFTTCVELLRAGRPVPVPDDHWNTPVLVDDVAAWTTALLDSPHTGVVHLGGPRRLSRLAWARHVAERVDADPGLLRPVPRRDTRYACRPRNACLHSERAGDLPELRGLRPVDVLTATTRLIEAGPPPS